MKKIFLVLFSLALFTRLAAENPSEASQSVTGTARIIEPITLTKEVDLDFGTLAKGSGSSTVIIDHVVSPPANTTGDVTILTSTPQTAAKFTIDGQEGALYNVTLPSSITLNKSESETLLVDNFTCSEGSSPNWGGAIPSGVGTFYVGATLHIDDLDPVGVYTGNFSVTVQYE